MLILVRHGQTAIKAGGLLQGRIDPDLDDTGRAQAAALAAALSGRHPSALVVSSPLMRARQTADAIAAALGVSVDVDARFIELDYGDFDGKAMHDISDETWALWRRDPAFTPPGGESLVDLDRRVQPALEEWSPTAAERDVIVVSHVSPIKSAVTWALGTGPESTWRCSLDRASVTTFAVGARGASLTGFNDTSHLR
ncbi:MAG: histidine phosphatase family protein [Ilumatobacteraceae bacterium]